jgi:hypothetical protein
MYLPATGHVVPSTVPRPLVDEALPELYGASRRARKRRSDDCVPRNRYRCAKIPASRRYAAWMSLPDSLGLRFVEHVEEDCDTQACQQMNQCA